MISLDSPDTRREIRDEVTASIIETLEIRDSALLHDEHAADGLRAQIRDILDETLAVLGESHTSVPQLSWPSQDVSRDVGRSRADQNVHPSESLSAASTVFDIGLPLLAHRLAGMSLEPSTPIAVARALHHSIMDRVVPASVGYVEVLLDKLAGAQIEERAALARELHDRVAHGIAAGLQRVTLSSPEDGTAVDLAMLNSAIEIFSTSLDDTRTIALELRQTVGDRTVDDAVRDYIQDVETRTIAGSVETIGTPRPLSVGVREEIFFIIREGIRNSVIHSHAHRLSITLMWQPADLFVEIADDGIGFEPTRPRAGSMGLITMRERAEVIGAELTITSQPKRGTTIGLHLRDR